MGIFSKTCEYAVKSVFFIAHRTENGSKVSIKEIAAGISSPEHFLAKILQTLSKKGIVKSIKGPHGGFYMDESTLKQPLINVVEAIDGNGLFIGCALGFNSCSESEPCPLHHEFKVIRENIRHMLANTTIKEFNGDLNLGITSLRK